MPPPPSQSPRHGPPDDSDPRCCRPLRRGRGRAALLAAAYASTVVVPAVAQQALPTSLPSSTVEISYNQDGYTGTIPSEFGLLTAVTSLDLGQNSLTGTLPTELGLMTALQTGRAKKGLFSKNSLAGVVPTQLGQLSMMTAFFWSSQNSHTGTIPTELGTMTDFRFTTASSLRYRHRLPPTPPPPTATPPTPPIPTHNTAASSTWVLTVSRDVYPPNWATSRSSRTTFRFQAAVSPGRCRRNSAGWSSLQARFVCTRTLTRPPVRYAARARTGLQLER